MNIDALSANPLFTGDQSIQLAEYLNLHLSAGDGIPIMSRVLESTYRPSRKLLEHTADVIANNTEFVLLDEQRVAFESVLAEARAGYHEAKKSVVLIQGGPGTGKSVIALHLVGELSKLGYNAQHAQAARRSLRTSAASSASGFGASSTHRSRWAATSSGCWTTTPSSTTPRRSP